MDVLCYSSANTGCYGPYTACCRWLLFLCHELLCHLVYLRCFEGLRLACVLQWCCVMSCWVGWDIFDVWQCCPFHRLCWLCCNGLSSQTPWPPSLLSGHGCGEEDWASPPRAILEKHPSFPLQNTHFNLQPRQGMAGRKPRALASKGHSLLLGVSE